MKARGANGIQKKEYVYITKMASVITNYLHTDESRGEEEKNDNQETVKEAEGQGGKGPKPGTEGEGTGGGQTKKGQESFFKVGPKYKKFSS